jgi:hypothetical protein
MTAPPTAHDTHTSIFGANSEGFVIIEDYDPSALGWLVGLLEGEGSFMKGPPSKPNLPRIAIAMTDLDVVVKVGALFGVKVFTGSPAVAKNKLIYSCSLCGSKAVLLMKMLKPSMSARRQGQIENALASYKPSYKRCADKGQAPLAPCDSTTLSWTAGLLEGEGSFMKGPPSKSTMPRITIQMTDLDVMLKIGAVFKVNPYLVSRPTRPQRKPIYACALVGSGAVALMKQLRPYMGIRRRFQIDKAVASYEPPKNHGKVYPTRDQLLTHGACSTNSLACHYGVSRCYIDRVRGSYKKVRPSREQLLAHGDCSTNALAKRYNVSWIYVKKTRDLSRLPERSL